MPAVAVVIPTYNRQKFLSRAIDSVLKQTFHDFGIVVVDDGSGSGIPAGLASWNDRRVRVIRHPTNRGVGAARNTGILHSDSEYIAFLDDDDEWLPDKLQLQVSMLQGTSSTIGGVYTGFSKVDWETDRVVGHFIPAMTDDLCGQLCRRNIIGTSTVLLRRECVGRVGLFDETIPSGQDYDLWIRVSQYYRMECIEQVLVRYHVHEHNLSTSSELKIRGLETQLAKNGEFFKQDSCNYSRRYLELGNLYHLNGETRKAREAYVRAIRLYPAKIRPYALLGLSLLGARAFHMAMAIRKRQLLTFG